jgi:DNA-binding MarR family transcriptional regulator
MTETRTAPPPVLFGQLLGQAHRASSALLNDLLAKRGTTFETWVGLNTLAQREADTDRSKLKSDLAAAFQTDQDSIETLLQAIEADGLIDTHEAKDAASVSLTADGQARFAELRESIGGLSAQLLGDVDPDDLAAARRVLEQMRIRAEALQG